METTYVMIKPNAVAQGYIGKIIERYETARLAVSAIKIKQLTRKDCEGFYAEHVGKGFFESLVEYMVSGPTVLIVLSGKEAIARARALNGATNPNDAIPGTIRFDFAPNLTENVVHSSDSIESAEREVSFFFTPEEIVKTVNPDYRLSSNQIGE